MQFPDINPVALQIGPLSIRWYALAYITGVVLGWRHALTLAKRNPAKRNPKGPSPAQYDAVVSWIILGILLGGRIGYILFYNLDHYLANPIEIFMLWRGGMAFHGGLLGVITATWIFCRKEKIRYFAFTDILACVVPIGLFFGRIANFINGELFGRVTDSPLGMIFPHGGPLPRHPSQLYQAGMEGIALFTILNILAYTGNLQKREGFLSGMFLLLYAIFRSIGELFREPDAQIGFLFGGITMGQLLSFPMILFGLLLIVRSLGKKV